MNSGQGLVLRKVESGGCGSLRGERRRRVGPGSRGAGRSGSILRRKKEQVGLPGFNSGACSIPAPRPVQTSRLFSSLETGDKVQYVCDGHWYLEKGCPQKRVRTGRRSSLDDSWPAMPPKRRVLGGELAGTPRKEGTQEGTARERICQGGKSSGGTGSPEPVAIRQVLSVYSGSREGCKACVIGLNVSQQRTVGGSVGNTSSGSLRSGQDNRPWFVGSEDKTLLDKRDEGNPERRNETHL